MYDHLLTVVLRFASARLVALGPASSSQEHCQLVAAATVEGRKVEAVPKAEARTYLVFVEIDVGPGLPGSLQLYKLLLQGARSAARSFRLR